MSTRLAPLDLRDELRDRLREADPAFVLAFARGQVPVKVSDGTVVRRLPDPGWFDLDGTKMYSAAWL